MTKNQNTSNSLAARARTLAEKTGMPYTAALQSLRTPRTEQTVPEPGFALTKEVERFVDGRDQIGVEYDLRAFLAERTARRYDCYECGEDVHTATDPTSVQFTVSVFDPDLNPGTHVMMTQYAHLACAPSEIRWAVPAEVPSQPFTVRVDAGTEDGEQRVVAYEITATAHLLPGDEPDGPQLPVLLLKAEVENYEPHPSLYEFFDFNLLEDGFPAQGAGELGAHGWSVRLDHPGTGPLTPSWVAVRAATAPADADAGHGHFFLGAVDLTDAFASAACERGQVLLLAGPVGPRTVLPDLNGEDADVLDLLNDRLVRGGWCPLDAPAGGHARPALSERALTRS
ncbi:hypothetical protein [Streptomyces nitrosporeus]|uniref:hypothetical protein n=1 Tax=Streptomyces nitrosporeus TaxID=28894 RepID=UPI0039A04998